MAPFHITSLETPISRLRATIVARLKYGERTARNEEKRTGESRERKRERAFSRSRSITKEQITANLQTKLFSLAPEQMRSAWSSLHQASCS